MSRSNGRLEPEVIVNVRRSRSCVVTRDNNISQFADGMAYSKGKLEEAFRPGGILDKPVKQPKETFAVKREDVDLIVRTYRLFVNQSQGFDVNVT